MNYEKERMRMSVRDGINMESYLVSSIAGNIVVSSRWHVGGDFP
jgi:hypothetical protein